MSYADLLENVPVSHVEHVPSDFIQTDPNERELYCWKEKKYTLHVKLSEGWMCPCGFFTEQSECLNVGEFPFENFSERKSF